MHGRAGGEGQVAVEKDQKADADGQEEPAAQRLEYNVRDDQDRQDEEAMYLRHFAAFEQWRDEVKRFLTTELPGTAAANRFKTADGEYNIGKLGFELARLRRQRENLALIYDNLDAYITRSAQGEPAASR